MEPCSKCQLDDDWSFSDTAPYLVPTVIMNRYKRLANGRNSKSLDKENNLDDDDLKYELSNRRKSMIPVVIPSTSNQNGYLNGNRVIGAGGGSGAGGETYIPRLILTNRDRERAADNIEESNRHNQSSASMATTTTTSSLSRRSSSSMTKKGAAGGSHQGAYCFSTIHTNVNGKPDEDDNDGDDGICDTIIITSGNTRTFIGNGRVSSGGRPSLKVYPKIYPTINGSIGRASSSSRPGWFIKLNACITRAKGSLMTFPGSEGHLKLKCK